MTTIDLSFPITCNDPIPADHGYFLYGAISRLIPGIHKSNGIAVHPICGRQIGNRKLLLMPFSCLTVRTADAGIGELLTLAGKRILLGESSLRIGTPEVRTLQPAPALRSRLVTIKLKEVGDDPVGLAAEQAAAAMAKAAKVQAAAQDTVSKAMGGYIYRASGGAARGTDTIPAMLSPGEFVVNARSTRQFFSQLQAINAGVQPIYRESGGEVTNISVGDVNISGSTTPMSPGDIARAINREIRRGKVKLR